MLCIHILCLSFWLMSLIKNVKHLASGVFDLAHIIMPDIEYIHVYSHKYSKKSFVCFFFLLCSVSISIAVNFIYLSVSCTIK